MNDYWSAQLWVICELLRELSIVNGCLTDGLESDYSFNVGLSAGQRSRCPGRQIELRLRGGSSKPRCLILRSEEHTSELQSHVNLVCRLLLEKKKLLRLTKIMK